ncbi:MAG: gliding motility-associated C-terminal domain-containing protein [Bacteroidales bacterium]|nr:gliding motility-associated C-terminal domain-containing protein [Bacteroidales bacterium]MCL2133269.1 gliding motility-associated C-terminal domain-containing protein [Bacteroidales bacterium]
MRKIITILLLCAPLSAYAQLTAPTRDYALPTTALTGNIDSVFVFYDDAIMTLTATQPNGHNAEFTWRKLDIDAASLDLYHQESGVIASTISDITEGGYQVAVRDLDDLTAAIDTFTAWVFRDTFSINSISYEIECDVLSLRMHTSPDILYEPYIIYNFPPNTGRVYLNQVQSVEWAPIDGAGQEISDDVFFPNVENPATGWRTNLSLFAFIDNPPPLCESPFRFRLVVTDVFGKSATYTMPNTINAISVMANPTIEAYVDNTWRDTEGLPHGEALYQLHFKHDKSANANHYQWKGFANAQQSSADRTLLWSESSTNSNAIIPSNPSIGEQYVGTLTNGDKYIGYTPGSYLVRLTVRNNVCVDSASVEYITVEPSSLDPKSIPNAFTPGKTVNNIFTFVKGEEPISMKYIYVYIYNRSGGMVYRYEGRYDAWEGWNGRMMNTGADVSEGVYYYVISGQGWDDIPYNTKQYSGYLHLFR